MRQNYGAGVACTECEAEALAARVPPSELPPHGVLRVATPATRSHLSRLDRAGRAWLLAPRLYVTDATLPRQDVARHHALAVIDHVWPGAVLCDRSGWRGPVPIEGWLFICHPDPARQADLVLPGLALSPRRGPGPLPGDIPLPGVAVHQAGQARSRRRGHPGPDDQLDVIAGSLPVRPVALVRARLAAVLGTNTGHPPATHRLAARLAGEPFDVHRLGLIASLIATLELTAPQPRPALGDH